MANTNQKNEKQPEQQPSEQPTAPVKPVELNDEELEQVVGGVQPIDYRPTAMPDLDAGAN